MNLRLSKARKKNGHRIGFGETSIVLKTRFQLKELSERKLQRTFEEINSAALAAQRKAEEDFVGVRKLAVQMQKHSTFDGSSTCSTARIKTRQKYVTSSDKSKVFKFKMEPNQSKPLQETQ